MDGTAITALLVALLWGFNIGALYPVIEVVSGGQSLQKWIDDEIADTQRHIADLHTLADLKPPAVRRRPTNGRN